MSRSAYQPKWKNQEIRVSNDIRVLQAEIAGLKDMLGKTFVSKATPKTRKNPKVSSDWWQISESPTGLDRQTKINLQRFKQAVCKSKERFSTHNLSLQHSRTSLSSMRKSKPFFSKLNPIICNDENDEFYIKDTCLFSGALPKRDNSLANHDIGRDSKINNSVRLASEEAVTFQRMTVAMKKAKEVKLGHYLNRASKLLKTPNQKSIRSSNLSLSKDCSLGDMSCDKSERAVPVQRSRCFTKFSSHLTSASNQTHQKLRNSVKALSDEQNDPRKELSTGGVRLKSFTIDRATPSTRPDDFTRVDQGFSKMYAMRKSVNIPSSKIDELECKSKEASELQDFIELEDYCRRTTAPNSKRSAYDSTPVKQKCNESVLKKLQSAVKCKKSTASRAMKSKSSKAHGHLVKTFAITIANNDKIIYN